MSRRGQAKGRPSVWRTKTKTKKQQRSGALKRADPAGALIPGRIWETAQKEGGEGLQNAEKQPPSGSAASPTPTPVAVAEAGNYGIQLSLLNFAGFSFKGILYLTEAVLLMLMLHANAAGLLTQLFVSVEGEPL